MGNICETDLFLLCFQITGVEDDSWLKAELNGAEGLVPGNYVDLKYPL